MPTLRSSALATLVIAATVTSAPTLASAHADASATTTPIDIAAGQDPAFAQLGDRTVALWVQEVDGTKRLFTAHTPTGEQRWSAPRQLSDDTADGVDNLAVAGSTDRVDATWVESGTDGRVMALSADRTGHWSAPRQIGTGVDSSVEPSVATTGDHAVIAFTSDTGTGPRAAVVQSGGTGDYDPAELVSPADQEALYPAAGTTAEGRVTVAWRVQSTDGEQADGAVWVAGESGTRWTSPRMVSDAHDNAVNLRVAYGIDNRPVVAWGTMERHQDNTLKVTTQSASGWQAPTVLGDPNLYSGYPTITRDHDHRVAIGWVETNGINQSWVRVARQTPDGTMRVHTVGTGDREVSPPWLSASGDRLAIAWFSDQGTAGNTVVRYAVMSPDDTVTEPESVSDVQSWAYTPTIAAAEDGTVTIGWARWNDGQGTVQATVRHMR